jgi:hypothetical protein
MMQMSREGPSSTQQQKMYALMQVEAAKMKMRERAIQKRWQHQHPQQKLKDGQVRKAGLEC